jgi:SPP1 gp7 family putative phage head morphogenesis protein
MARSPFAVSLLYKRLGRTPPKPGLVRARPPGVPLEEAEYARRLEALLRAWYDQVETIARGEVRRGDAAREDASKFEEQIRAAYEALVRASGLAEYIARAAGRIVEKQSAYVERVTKIPPAGNIAGRQALIENFRQENLSLITGMGDDQIQEIADIIRPAQAIGQRWEEIAPDLEKRLGVGVNRARLIARDQTNKFNGSMQKITQESAGIQEYTWSTSKDFAVRGRPGGVYEDSKENHWKLEGKTFRWNAPPIIPGTSERAHPGERIQCRCVAIPRIPLFES